MNVLELIFEFKYVQWRERRAGLVNPTNTREIWHQRWAREPQQARSALRWTAQLDAAQAILEEEGLDAVTVARVAKRAGVSVGATYHYFQDKQALIYAVVERFSREAAERARSSLDPARWEGASLMEILEAYLRHVIKVGRKFRGTHLAHKRLAMEDRHIAEHLATEHRAIHEPILKLLEARAEEVESLEPNRSIAVVMEVLWATIDQRLSNHAAGTSSRVARLSDERLIGELLEVAGAYLGVESE